MPLGGADDRVFSGTATPYLPGDPAANLMYAFKVSRSCGNEPSCVTLAVVEPNCPAFDFSTSVPRNEAFAAAAGTTMT